MKYLHKIDKSRRNERGVALLFAIGLLALMLMLCVSFSMESLQSQKMASNNSNRSAAKALAQSAIRHISSSALYYCDTNWDSGFINNVPTTNYFITDFSFLVSRDSTKNDTDMLNKLLPFKTPFVGKDYTGGGVDSYKNRYDLNSANDKINWVYVYDKAESATDKQIVGRFAYRVLPQASTTQVNLAYFLAGRQAVSSSNDSWMNEFSCLVDSANSSNLKAAGAPWEVFAAMSANSKYFKSSGTGAVTSREFDRMQRLFSDGKQPADLEVFKTMNGNTPYYYHRYNLSQTPVVDGSTDVDKVNSLITCTTARNKLLPFSFDELTAEKFTDASAKPMTFSKEFLRNSYYKEPLVSGASTPKANLFFLGMIADEAGSFADVVTRRKQIAANFLDYCDNDDKPASDSDNWETVSPTFTGNEKTLYINEIGIHNHVKTSVSTSGDAIALSVTPTFLAELIDVYGGLDSSYTLNGGVASITLIANATVKKLADKTDSENTHTPSGLALNNIEFPLVFADSNITSFSQNGGYFTGSKGFGEIVNADKFKFTLPAGYENFKITEYDVEITGIKVAFAKSLVLKRGAQNADCVNIGDTVFTVTTEDYTDDGGNAALKPITFSQENSEADVIIGNMAAKDPRQNLNVRRSYAGEKVAAADWKKSDWVFDPQTVSGYGSEDSRLSMSLNINNGVLSGVSGVRNKYSDPSKTKWTGSAFDTDTDNNDCETVTDPAATGTSRISTAYIRNGVMQSMWELGYIHRGAAWETINLLGSNVSLQDMYNYLYGTHNDSAGSSGFAGTKYVDGDAAILDTVKLSKYAISWGMLDVNMLRSTFPGYDYTGENDDRMLFDGVVSNLTKHENPGSTLGENPPYLFNDTDKAALLAGAKGASAMSARSQFADSAFDSVFSSSTQFTTDALREEAVGKLMPFLKAEPALVTVFHADIVVQTIRDVGGVEVAKLKSDGTLTDPQSTTLGTFDKVTSGTETVYLDDITGQVKLRATFDFNPFTGKVKLRQIKYLD